MSQDNHTKGLVIVSIGVLAITPDVLLIRLIDTDPWNLLIWRGFLQALGLAVIFSCFHGWATPRLFLAIGRSGALISCLFAVETMLFINALEKTSAANLLVIVATAPFFAAIFSRIFLKEFVPFRTWMAILAAVLGIIVLTFESLGSPSLQGDLQALGGAMLLGANFTVIRHSRQTNMIPAIAISGLIVGFVALLIAPPITLTTSQLSYVLFMGLLMLPLCFSLLTLGPRYLPAPEVSLLFLLETVLGPLWVWLVIGEAPGPWALIGGGIVILSLAVHALLTQRALKQSAAAHV